MMTSIKSYKDILIMLSDLAKAQNETMKYPSHENKILLWQDMFHSSLKNLLHDNEFDSDIKENAKSCEILLFSMYDTFHKYSKVYCSKDLLKERVKKIDEKHQVEQRSSQWYDDMKTMLTASEFHKLFESERTRGQLVLSKVNPEKFDKPHAVVTQHMSPMDWGVRFEPVVKNYLERTWNCNIYDCGRLKHNFQAHLGASPDGIINTEACDKFGRLVEIKCPYSRKIGGTVPYEYWIQMQIQLEVTDLYECEFVEVEILSKNPKNMNPDLSGSYIEKNILYLMEKDGVYVYAYDMSQKESYISDGYVVSETIDYIINKVHNVLVKRDTAWYNSTKKVQEKFWDDVEKARKNEYVLPERKRPRKEKECMMIEES